MPETSYDSFSPFKESNSTSDMTAGPSADQVLLHELTRIPPGLAPTEQKTTVGKQGAEPENKSYLQTWIDAGTSRIIKDDETRARVNSLSADFIKTTSIATGGKAGLISTFITYGLDKARPADSWKLQAADFALGGAKGETTRGIFSVVGGSKLAAPLKGALMGISLSTADEVFKRETFSNPASLTERLRQNAFAPEILLNALEYTAVTGLRSGMNFAAAGALSDNRIASGMVNYGTFAFISGSAGEAARQKQEKGRIDLDEILLHGALGAAASAAGVGLGMKAFDGLFSKK